MGMAKKDIKETRKQRRLGRFVYIEAGEGYPVLLLLHGLFGEFSNFSAVFDWFEERCRVVMPSLPIATISLRRASVEGLVKYVEEFVDALGLRDGIVPVGNSLGGHLAVLFTYRNPQKVSAMVLTGSSGLYERTLGNSYPRRGDREFVREKVRMTFYDPAFVTDELVDRVMKTIEDRRVALRLVKISRSAMTNRVVEELKQIRVPVCLIWGKDDQITPVSVAEEFLEYLPDAELHLLDRCGHAPMMEHPEAFCRIMEGFLVRHGLLAPAGDKSG